MGKRCVPKSFYDLLEGGGSRQALVCGEETFTYDELKNAVDVCASDLINMGVQVGDHVGIWSFNSANVLICFMAIARIGAVAVLGNYSMQKDEICELFAMTDIEYLLYGPVAASRKMPDLYAQVLEELKIDDAHALNISSKTLSFRNRLGEMPSNIEEIEKRVAESKPRQDAYIIFTTGTTSKPKAVLDSQEGLLFTAGRHAELRKMLSLDQVAVALPLFHIFGLFVIVSYMHKKACIHLAERVGADFFVQKMKSSKSRWDLATVTAIYQALIDHPEFSAVEKQANMLTTAGGMLTPVQFAKLELAFSNARLFNEYGQTESHGCITYAVTDDPIEKRAYSLGKAFGEEVKIFDANKGFVGAGEIGEICIKSEGLMNGYYKLPKEKQAIDQGGWLHTGDLGVFDLDGYLHMAGRSKDIIIKNGENISPVEVETAVSAIDGVTEVKVFGVPHQIYGECIVCCLVTENGEHFVEQDLNASLKGSLSAAKIPNYYFYFGAFPLAPSGKLDQRGLRIQMLDRLIRLYIENKLEVGLTAIDITIQNYNYNIVPISRMMQEFARQIGFSEKKSMGVCLAVEEFLSERIVNAYEDVGEIRIKVIFYKEWFCIEFSDSGKEYEIKKSVKTSLCAKLILNYVDNFEIMKENGKLPSYMMSFLYEEGFDVREYLVQHDNTKES